MIPSLFKINILALRRTYNTKRIQGLSQNIKCKTYIVPKIKYGACNRKFIFL